MESIAEPRRATVSEVEEIVRLALGLFTELNGDDPGPGWAASARSALRRRITADLTVFVAEHPGAPGRLVALAAGLEVERLSTARKLTGRVGYIQWVAVDSAWRRRSLARPVSTAVLGAFDARGVGMDELHSSADARGLYVSLGFTDTPHTSMRRYPVP